MLTATPVLFAAWALGGFYMSLGPALVRLTVHSDSRLLGAVAVFAMAGTAAVAVLLLRNVSAVTTMKSGILLLMAGVALAEVAVATSSAVGLFAGMLASGAGSAPRSRARSGRSCRPPSRTSGPACSRWCT